MLCRGRGDDFVTVADAPRDHTTKGRWIHDCSAFELWVAVLSLSDEAKLGTSRDLRTDHVLIPISSGSKSNTSEHYCFSEKIRLCI
jgi:hypothetical protein